MKKKLIAGILSAITLSTCAFAGVAYAYSMENPNKNGVESTFENMTENGFSTKFVNTQHVKLRSATPMTVAATGNTVSQTLEATVYPETASNKAVDWTVAWADETNADVVTNYVTVVPTSNGSRQATVTCHKPFEGNIIVTVKTRESGYTADCIVSFVGIPTEFVLESNLTAQSNGYHLGVGNTYTFNVSLENPFHSVGSDYQKVTATLQGVGSVILSYKEQYLSTGNVNWFDTSDEEVTLDSLKDNFITVNYENGVLIVNTLRSIESYYESEKTMDGGRTKSYTNIFRSYVSDCYFTVKLTESTSGLSKTIKFRFDDSVVAGVEMDENEMLF